MRSSTSSLFTIGSIFLLMLLINFSHISHASAQGVGCGTDEYYKWRMSQDPSILTDKINYEKTVTDNQHKEYKMAPSSSGGLRVIPVVFHIIHNYGPENIAKQHVIDQVATMNRNYQKLNPDTASVRSIFKPLIANCQIEFILASKDPNGNWTDGVDRVASTLTYAGNDNVKGLVQWDPNKYLNIWVVQTININVGFLPPGYVVAGYSSFPTDKNTAVDGIVVRSDQFLIPGNTTLTHECGHYLNLYHPFETIFGYECGSDPRITGDRVDDTPAISGPSYGCSSTLNTCTLDTFDGGGDRPDMIEAFMDYSNCPHMFTSGQLVRINAALKNITKRANLYTQSNIVATGVDSLSKATAAPAPKPDFYTNTLEICEGGTVNFIDNSFNAPVTTYTWSVPGATLVSPSKASDANPTFTFSTIGQYSVTLTVSNANGSNKITKTSYINVVSKSSTVKTIKENFENGVPSTWTASQDNNGLGWSITNKAAVSGTNSYYLNNFNAQYDSIYSFIIPEVDLGFNKSQTLNFKMAYSQTTSTSSDIFRVLVADLCSSNPNKFNTVFNQSGAAIATAHTVHATDFVPAVDEWKQVSIDLSAYKTLDKLSIKFYWLNHRGNNVYIDDINLGDNSGINTTENIAQGISIYPNPASDNFIIKYPSNLNGDVILQAYDVSGREIGNMKLNASEGQSLVVTKQSININKDGVYYLKLSSGSNIFTQKLIILQ